MCNCVCIFATINVHTDLHVVSCTVMNKHSCSSDTGIKAPEMYIFSQLLNIACALCKYGLSRTFCTLTCQSQNIITQRHCFCVTPSTNCDSYIIYIKCCNAAYVFTVSAVVTILVRCKIIYDKVDADDVKLRHLSLVACVFGITGCDGLTVVANFPVSAHT